MENVDVGTLFLEILVHTNLTTRDKFMLKLAHLSENRELRDSTKNCVSYQRLSVHSVRDTKILKAKFSPSDENR